jgi:branched-chain amino acid transport system permease protein
VSDVAERAAAPTAAPPSFRIQRSTALTRLGLAALTAAVAVFAALPEWGDPALMRDMVELFSLLALAQMWNLLAGYAGLVSIGQQVYVGLGSYALFVLANNEGYDLWVSVGLAGVVTFLLAFPIGAIAFRLRGGYFAIGTWVIAEAVQLLVENTESVGGGSGATLTAASQYDVDVRQRVTYWIALGVAVASIVIILVIVRSRLGLGLRATRDNEEGARGLGVGVLGSRFVIYVIAGLVTGLVGAINLVSDIRLQPEAAFSVANWTAPIIFIVVIGGIGTIEGPILGTVIYFLLQDNLADFDSWYLIILGAIAVGLMIVAPRGLWGTIAQRWNLQLLGAPRLLRLRDHARKRGDGGSRPGGGSAAVPPSAAPALATTSDEDST